MKVAFPVALGYLIINAKSDGTTLFILHIIVMIQQKRWFKILAGLFYY